MTLFAGRLSNRGSTSNVLLVEGMSTTMTAAGQILCGGQRKYEQAHNRAWRLCLFVLAVPV
jgi:hypothetical protein